MHLHFREDMLCMSRPLSGNMKVSYAWSQYLCILPHRHPKLPALLPIKAVCMSVSCHEASSPRTSHQGGLNRYTVSSFIYIVSSSDATRNMSFMPISRIYHVTSICSVSINPHNNSPRKYYYQRLQIICFLVIVAKTDQSKITPNFLVN